MVDNAAINLALLCKLLRGISVRKDPWSQGMQVSTVTAPAALTHQQWVRVPLARLHVNWVSAEVCALDGRVCNGDHGGCVCVFLCPHEAEVRLLSVRHSDFPRYTACWEG